MEAHDACPARPGDELAPPPPLGGGDIELGNFIEGRPWAQNTCAAAAAAILAEIDGYPAIAPAGWSGTRNERDWCRKFLASNGSSIYIDLGHTEVCLPEITAARSYVACFHAMLRIVRGAQVRAARKLPPGQRLHVLVNNSDGRGNSYGAHLNFLVHRRTHDALFMHKLHLMLFLAAYQASSIVFAGQGKVGSENGRPPVAFQLSQRADFVETLVAPQTTFRRPLVNQRDEPLCGRDDPDARRWARLHVIFYDANLCHVACYLKFGVLQIILAMIASEYVTPEVILEDPVAAVVAWSHDVSLRRRMSTLTGDRLTAVELQLRFLEQARRFVEDGRCNVPEAAHILALWEDTLEKLKTGALAELASRLDWVLKLSTLRQALEDQPDLAGDATKLKYLDHVYGSLDPDEGLYWSFERAGLVERVVDDAAIDSAATRPPDDTRAWTRASLLRMADPATVRAVDWDSIEFRFAGDGSWPRRRTLAMGDPCGLTRSAAEGAFVHAHTLADTLDLLGVP